MLLLTVLACAQPASVSEGQRFALALAAPSLEQSLLLCTSLSPPTNEDCLVAAHERHREWPPGSCQGIHSERWRSECHFLAAEAAVRKDDPDRALSICPGAEPHSRSCVQHIWQIELLPLARIPPEQALPQVQAAASRYKHYLVEGERQIWREYWMLYFSSHPISSQPCEGLPELPGCVDGWQVASARSLWEGLHRSAQGQGASCMASLPWPSLRQGYAPESPARAREYACKTHSGKLPWTPVFSTKLPP